MVRKSPRLLMFLSVSFVLIFLLVYTSYLYFRVYAFTADFEAEVHFIKVEDFNETHVNVIINLSLKNPSEFSVKVSYIRVILSLNINEPIFDKAAQLGINPEPLPPFQSMNETFSGFCERGQVEGVPSPRVWNVEVRTTLQDVPLTGRGVSITRDVQWTG